MWGDTKTEQPDQQRKIISFQAVPDGLFTGCRHHIIYALCDDGTMWIKIGQSVWILFETDDVTTRVL